jgi:uncharacterized SAM-dependent methyltransferase
MPENMQHTYPPGFVPDPQVYQQVEDELNVKFQSKFDEMQKKMEYQYNQEFARQQQSWLQEQANLKAQLQALTAKLDEGGIQG